VPRPADSAASAKDRSAATVESQLVKVVRERLRANGDWNINDWKDAARALADQVEGLENRASARRIRRRIFDGR
jgi:hypothetical protein